jgi:hypothetical protein
MYIYLHDTIVMWKVMAYMTCMLMNFILNYTYVCIPIWHDSSVKDNNVHDTHAVEIYFELYLHAYTQMIRQWHGRQLMVCMYTTA